MIRNRSQRRRLVLSEDTAPVEDPVAETATKPARKKRSKKKTKEKEVRAYAYGADRRNQLKTTDLFPKRFFAFSLVVLGLLSVIGLLNLLAWYAPSWQQVTGANSTAFEIAGQGTLSSWFSSFLLIITGIASLQIYALRKHRCDDYQGTYRLWLWLSALFIIASIHCVVDLRLVARNAIEYLFQVQLDQRVWLVLSIKFLALTALVVRGMFEVRASRGTMITVALVWLAYCGAMAMSIPVVRDSTVVNSNFCYGNLMLFATAGLLVSHLVYTRYVYMKAHGLMADPIDKQEKKAAKIAAKQARIEAKAQAKLDKLKEAEEKAENARLEKERLAQEKIDMAAEKKANALADKEAKAKAKAAAKEEKLAAKKKAKEETKSKSKSKTAQPPVENDDESQQVDVSSKSTSRRTTKSKVQSDSGSDQNALLAALSKNSKSSKKKAASSSQQPELKVTGSRSTKKSTAGNGPLSSKMKSRSSSKSSSANEHDEIEAEILKLQDARDNLSKAEMRRLRKLEKRQRRAA